jgi:hypothetical protein
MGFQNIVPFGLMRYVLGLDPEWDASVQDELLWVKNAFIYKTLAG